MWNWKNDSLTGARSMFIRMEKIILVFFCSIFLLYLWTSCLEISSASSWQLFLYIYSGMGLIWRCMKKKNNWEFIIMIQECMKVRQENIGYSCCILVERTYWSHYMINHVSWDWVVTRLLSKDERKTDDYRNWCWTTTNLMLIDSTVLVCMLTKTLVLGLVPRGGGNNFKLFHLKDYHVLYKMGNRDFSAKLILLE